MASHRSIKFLETNLISSNDVVFTDESEGN